MNYFMHNTDMTVDLRDNSVQLLEKHAEDWRVTIVDTGLNTMTAGRLKRVQKYIGNETFCLTYGDGVTDLDITDTIARHKSSGKAISMTVYKPVNRFGSVRIDSNTNQVTSFEEKPDGEGSIAVFGNRWICFATISRWRKCGMKTRRLGKYGNLDIIRYGI